MMVGNRLLEDIVQVPQWGNVVHVVYVQGDDHGAYICTVQIKRVKNCMGLVTTAAQPDPSWPRRCR